MWNPFRRPEPPEVALTETGYVQWLHACRPPLTWFLGLSDIERARLAELGKEHMQDLALALGYAVQDPEIAEAGMAASEGKPEGEEVLARRLAADLAAKALGGQRAPEMSPEPEPVTMGGFGKRRAEGGLDAAKKAGATLFGKKPDDIRGHPRTSADTKRTGEYADPAYDGAKPMENGKHGCSGGSVVAPKEDPAKSTGHLETDHPKPAFPPIEIIKEQRDPPFLKDREGT